MQPPAPSQDPDTKKDFSLEKRIPQPPLPPLPSIQATRAAFVMRLIIWASPAPALIIAGIGIHRLFLPPDWQAILFFTLIPVIGLGCGYCDSFLSTSVPKKDGTPVLPQALRHAVFFALAQILVGPAIIVGFIAVISTIAPAFL